MVFVQSLCAVSCIKMSRTLKIPLLGHLNILHTLIGMGSAALAAAVPYPAKMTQIPHKGQWSHKNEEEKKAYRYFFCTLLVVFKLHTHTHTCAHAHTHAYTHFHSPPTHPPPSHTHTCVHGRASATGNKHNSLEDRCFFCEYSSHHYSRADRPNWLETTAAAIMGDTASVPVFVLNCSCTRRISPVWILVDWA